MSLEKDNKFADALGRLGSNSQPDLSIAEDITSHNLLYLCRTPPSCVTSLLAIDMQGSVLYRTI